MVRLDKARMAVSVMLLIARWSEDGSPASGSSLAQQCGFKPRTLEALLQNLSRSGFLESVRGQNGGYRLSVSSHFSLGELIRAALDFGPPSKERSGLNENSASPIESVHQIVDSYLNSGTEKLLSHFDKIPFSKLIEAAKEKGVPSRPHEWLDFVI